MSCHYASGGRREKKSPQVSAWQGFCVLMNMSLFDVCLLLFGLIFMPRLRGKIRACNKSFSVIKISPFWTHIDVKILEQRLTEII